MTPHDRDSAAARPARPRDLGSSAFPGPAEAPDPGLTRRGLAGIVDLALAVGLATGLRRLLADAGFGEHLDGAAGWLATTVLPGWLLLAAAESLPGRAGPGKRLLGLKLVPARPGLALGIVRIAARTAVKLVPAAAAACALGFPPGWDGRAPLDRWRLTLFLGANLWFGIYLAAAAMTRRRQSLHDLATGTRVARRESGPPTG